MFGAICGGDGPPLRGSAIPGVSHSVTNPIHVRESRGPRVPVPGSASTGVHESLDPFPLLGGCRKKDGEG